MPVTYIRTAPFPRCKYYGERMPYWIIGQRDEDACHPGCAAAAIVEGIPASIREVPRTTHTRGPEEATCPKRPSAIMGEEEGDEEK